MYSEAKIFIRDEFDENNWLNHTFIRIFDEIPQDEAEEEEPEDQTLLEYISEILSNPNIFIPIIGITSILTSTIVALLIIRRSTIRKQFEEYKRLAKEEQTQTPQKGLKNKKT